MKSTYHIQFRLFSWDQTWGWVCNVCWKNSMEWIRNWCFLYSLEDIIISGENPWVGNDREYEFGLDIGLGFRHVWTRATYPINNNILLFYFWVSKSFFFLFLFWKKSFNLWHPLLIIAIYHQTKTPISFWCRRRLNLKFLIQPSETLPVELTRTHELVSLYTTVISKTVFQF